MRPYWEIEPMLLPIKNGWSAHGIGWAVHSSTKDEAVEKYWKRVALYREVDRRGSTEESPLQEGAEGSLTPDTHQDHTSGEE